MNAGFVFYGYGRAVLWMLLWLGNYFSPLKLCCSLLSQQRTLQGQPQVWMHCWWAQALWYIQMSSSFIFRSNHTNWRVFSGCFLRDPNLHLKNKRNNYYFSSIRKGANLHTGFNSLCELRQLKYLWKDYKPERCNYKGVTCTASHGRPYSGL